MLKNAKKSKMSLMTIETKKSKLTEKSGIPSRLLGLIQAFAEDAVDALDKTSPFKIKGDILMQENEEFEQILKDLDVE